MTPEFALKSAIRTVCRLTEAFRFWLALSIFTTVSLVLLAVTSLCVPALWHQTPLSPAITTVCRFAILILVAITLVSIYNAAAYRKRLKLAHLDYPLSVVQAVYYDAKGTVVHFVVISATTCPIEFGWCPPKNWHNVLAKDGIELICGSPRI